ncbi:MFS transporter [Leifsonia sp. 1010]|uniref:MFS transporter n=1 Tax=Leifsonia sp. 1010 TaxID=2817769 RepID=UPI0028665970|nr:MFS transporter [Leifsonia sp. 1010]MDR6611304.1 MFS family permease [Leifsonia sp. 1010]
MDPRRSFALLWLSQAFSQFGTSVSSLAYPLLILQLTGSAAQAGLVGAVVAATGLLTRLPAGSVADRNPPRALMLTADGMRCAFLAALAVTVASGAAGTGLVVAIVALEVTAGAVFGPAEFRMIRAITPPSERSVAVGRMQSRSQLAGLLGPLAGGALFGVAPWLPFAVDAGSYLVSLVLILAVPSVPAPRTAAGARGGAWRWLRSDPLLLPAALWVAFLTATFSAVGLIVIVVAQDRGAGSAGIGLMSSISAAGGLVGALITPAVQRRLRPGAVFRIAATLDTAATLALLPLQSPVLIGVAGAVAFLSAPIVAASLFGEVSRRSPDELVGRVQSTVVLVVGLVAPVTPILAGLVLDRSGSVGGIIACASAFAVLTLVAVLLPAFRRRSAALDAPANT